jgi:hypothetical protein
MPVSLRDAGNRPAQVSKNLPVLQGAWLGKLTTRIDICIPVLLGLSYATENQVIMPEPPRANARPGEILCPVSYMSKFPIEHAAQAFGANHHVTDSEVAVHQYKPVTFWRILTEPAQRKLKSRMRLTENFELPGYSIETRLSRRATWFVSEQKIEPFPVWINPMNQRQLLPQLAGEEPACFGKARFADNPSAYRFSF